MKKEIKLYIHGGFGRAGTTLLQKKIFNNFDKIFSFGKDFSLENKDFFDLQQKCFNPEYVEIKDDYPRNNFFFIDKFSEKIANIFENKNYDKFLFSDEIIFDFFNYNAERNLVILKELIIQLSFKFEIKLKIILSIRNQSDILISNYAQEFTRFKKVFGDYDKFLETIFEKKPEIGSIFKYDDFYNRLVNLFNCEVHFFILENFKINQDLEISRVENFLEEKLNRKIDIREKINPNLGQLSSSKQYNLRSNNVLFYLTKLYSKMTFLHNNKIKNSQLFQNFKSGLKKTFKSQTSGKIENNEINLKKIKSFYSKSNSNLEKIIDFKLSQSDYF